MTSGRRKGFSKIDKADLGESIKELKKMGLSYSQIIEDVKRNYGVILNKANLTKFFQREGEPREEFNFDDCSTIASLHLKVKSDVYNLRKAVKRDFEDIYIKLDKSSLKPMERSNLKKVIRMYEKRVVREVDTLDSVTLNALGEVNKYVNRLSYMLLDMSNELCPNCSSIVGKYADRVLNEEAEVYD